MADELGPTSPAAAPLLHVGSPMWADRRWVGTLFPAATRPGDELAVYSTWCNAVEGNTTFYALPSPAAVDRWRTQAPPWFRFCFKLPRTVTHDRRLRNTEAPVGAFLAALEPLADRLGPLWIQLPPSFGARDLGVLDSFLASLQRHTGGEREEPLSWGVEVRNRAFEAEGSAERELNDLLHEHRVERVLIDTRAVFAGPRVTDAEIEAFERKPRLRVRPVAIGPRPVVRFIGQTDPRANPMYWAPWVTKVAQWLNEGRSPYVFIHTPDNVAAPLHAREFHAAVAEHVVGLAPLPEPLRAPAQELLFDSDARSEC